VNGKIYKIPIYLRKGPCPLLKVTDQDDNDITTSVLPSLGPDHDWHKQHIFPSFWGKSMIKLETIYGDYSFYTESESLQPI
jgi:hypothetical protein